MSWWNTSWLYRKKLTFANNAYEAFTNFTVLVHLKDGGGAGRIDVDFAQIKAGGADIRFIDDNDSTELKYEIERWDDGAEEAWVWVKVPTLAKSDTDFIYMYWGNAAASHNQNAPNTWDTYFQAVYHFNGNVLDSKGNHNGTNSGTSDIAGKIGRARDFNPNDYISLGDWELAGDHTFEAWVNFDSLANRPTILSKSKTTPQQFAAWWWHEASRLRYLRSNDGNWPGYAQPVSGISTGTWYYCVMAISGSTIQLYVSGASIGTGTTDGSTFNISDAWQIGRFLADLASTYLNAKVDEVRMASARRSSNWVAAQYKSMTDAYITAGIREHQPQSFEENLALLESLPIIKRQFPALEEAIALKDVSSMPLGPDIVFEAAIALKNVSLAPSMPDIILQESVALKEDLTSIERALLLTEAIGLKESLPLIHREPPPLAESIALKESLPVISRELPPLEEALALADSFPAAEQTIVRISPSAEFLAEQAKRSNQPVKRIWLYINSSLYDITDKFMTMGPIDRKMTYKPGETKLLTISDQDLVMSNADKYFSDLNPDSPFYDRDYAGADQVKVYAGFIIPSTGYAEVLQKADMKLISIELMTKEGHAHLRCQDSFREVFDIYVGMPDSDGTPNPLTYTSKTFKYIMDDLLINKAGIPSAKVDIEDVDLTFSSLSFEKKKVVDCGQKLSEVARGSTVVLGDGTVQFRRFISEVTDVDLILRSGENYSRLRYVGQDFTLKVNKVVVIGAAGVYAEAEIPGETGVTLKYENDAILTVGVANDIAIECLGRFAVRPALMEVTGEYLPSLDLKSVVKVYEPNSMMDPAIMQIRELALDIVRHSTRMLLSIPDAAGRSKTWSTKAEWEGGTLVDLIVPVDNSRLELKRRNLSGTGTFIFDAGAGLTANWIYFNHSKKDTKIILRDDFRENTLAEYFLETIYGGWGYTAPTYDSVNKRISFNTGDNKSSSMRPKNISIQNFILSYKFKGTSKYPMNFGFLSGGRWIDNSNMYMAIINDTGSPYPSAIAKVVAEAWSDLRTGAVCHKVGTQYQLKTTFNGNSLKVELVGVGSLSVSNSTFPNAGPVKIGAYQGIGWIDDLLLEHYALPSPANTSVTFQFATSDNGTDWSAWTNDIVNCVDSRYIKVKVSMSRTTFLTSAMPVLEDMTVGYFLKGS